MAAFKQQFSVLDPFNLPKRSEFFAWPFQIAHEAGELLRGRDLNWLIAIAQQLEVFIQDRATDSTLAADGPKQAQAFNTMAILGTDLLNRDWYGDVHLFAKAEAAHDWSKEKVRSARWERFAVLSLWKIADAYAMLDRKSDPKGEFTVSAQEMQRWTFSGGYTIEAMRALQIAQSILLEKRLLSKQNSKNAMDGHAKLLPFMEEALRLAESRPHKSRQKAAEYIFENLPRSDGSKESFSVETIKRWLRKAGWIPLHERG